MKKNKLVFVDAETNGLYGAFLTVALVVVDENCNKIDKAYYGITRDNMIVTEPWTLEHVLPILGEYEKCENEVELLEKTWQFWSRYADDAYLVADVIFPTETKLFQKCVEIDIPSRLTKSPFPFFDLSDFVKMCGFDSLESRTKLANVVENNIQHNALFDVEMSIKIYKELSNKYGFSLL